MLDHIAPQGVLVYLDVTAVLPKPLRHLRSAEAWRERVHTLLAQCHAMLAHDTPLDGRKPYGRRSERQFARSVV